MAQQTINVGTSPNDGTGTPLRTAFQYTNSNFSELYTAVGPSGNNIVVPGTATITGDLTVDTSTLKVDSANNRVGIGTASPISQFANTNTTDTITGAVTDGFAWRSVSNDWAAAIIARPASGNAYALRAHTGGATASDYPLWLSSGASAGNTVLTATGNGVFTFGDGAGGTRMTLNSTGLGVGGSPINKLTVTVAPGTSTSDGLRVTDSTRSIIAGQTGATYSYLGIGGNQNLIYTSGARLDIVADGQSLFLRTGTANYLNLDSSGNVGVGVSTFGTSAAKVLGLANATAPSTSPAGMGQLYVEAGALKYRGSSGTVTTLANA